MSTWKGKNAIIGRGKVGWHSKARGNVSCSGGSLDDYLKDAEDNCPIYDASEADLEAFADFVCNGPMVNIDLQPGEIKKFNDHDTLAMMMPALGGGFKAIGLASLTEGGTAGLKRLDYVAVDIYMALLREKVPGVRTGIVRSGEIVWDAPAMPQEKADGQLPLF